MPPATPGPRVIGDRDGRGANTAAGAGMESSLCKLANETLSKLFLCLAADDDDSWVSILQAITDVGNLMTTCRLMRSICLAAKLPLATLAILPPSAGSPFAFSSATALHDRLTITGIYPLRVVFDLPVLKDVNAESFRIWTVLLQHASRLSVFHLKAPFICTNSPAYCTHLLASQALTPAGTPMLRVLSLTTDDPHFMMWCTTHWNGPPAFINTARIRSLTSSIRLDFIPQLVPASPPSFISITDLELILQLPHSWLPLLKYTPNLTSLGWGFNEEVEDVADKIILPSLVLLRLYGADQPTPFVAPNLRVLEVVDRRQSLRLSVFVSVCGTGGQVNSIRRLDVSRCLSFLAADREAIVSRCPLLRDLVEPEVVAIIFGLAIMLLLPPDISERILIAAFGCHIKDFTKFCDNRLTICLVCRRWRNLIYSAASAWSRLPVSLYTSSRFVRFCFTKTRKADLSIIFVLIPLASMEAHARRLGIMETCTPVEIVDRTFPILVDDRPRIRDIRVHCGHSPSFSRIKFWLMIMDTGILRSATLVLDDHREEDPSRAGGAVFGSPGPIFLSELQLGSFIPCEGLEALCGNLVVLKLTCMTRRSNIGWDVFRRVLLCASNLRLLQLFDVECAIVEPYQAEPLVLPQLKDLLLSYSRPSSAIIASRINMPSLTGLRLDIRPPHGRAQRATVDDFVKLCGSWLGQLTIIDIGAMELSIAEGDALFSAMINIRALDMRRASGALKITFMHFLRHSTNILKELAKVRFGVPLDFAETERILRKDPFGTFNTRTCLGVSGWTQGNKSTDMDRDLGLVFAVDYSSKSSDNNYLSAFVLAVSIMMNDTAIARRF
ncbi:hypothetical protein DFH06DRAFT_1334344 [Mycena polygramma]|nr:hypothetical protein DFH06DRAFT_1334344 [Mycena polygramma]